MHDRAENAQEILDKEKKSASALLMYAIIGISFAVCIVCFTLYYGKKCDTDAVLWAGIVAFMLVYHLWLRLIMGNVSKLFPIRHTCRFFRALPFEKKLYALLRVKKWKGHMPTYNPGSFSLEKHSLSEIADTMAKAETDHWINEIISLSSLLFSLVWGAFSVFLVTALLAMAFDAQFIIMQRYNRPRVLAVLTHQKARKNKQILSV